MPNNCLSIQLSNFSLSPSLLFEAELTSADKGMKESVLSHCRCDAGYTGQHCEKKDYSVLYVVPGPVRFQYVLIAAVIGTIQIAIICVVVLCITRLVTVLSFYDILPEYDISV